MKKFNVTVNGKTYAVEVEEVGAGQGGFAYQPVKQAPVQQPLQQPVQAAPVAAPVQPAPASVPKAAPVDGDGELMSAPMPGTILDILVTEGQAITKCDIVLILEAMKMENTISSDRDGKVLEIKVDKGASVLEGADLVIIG